MRKGPVKDSSIHSSVRYCGRCGKNTEHRGYVPSAASGPRFQCLPCARARRLRRTAEIKAGAVVEPRDEKPCPLELQPTEKVCMICFLTICDCD